MQFQIGQIKFIWSNGAGSVIIPTADHEIIVNIKPSAVGSNNPVLQLFVMNKVGE